MKCPHCGTVTSRNGKIMKLTKVQNRALAKIEKGKWYSAYDLQESLASLNALVQKGYLKSKTGLGSLYSPRTSIKYARKN